uniref:Secreted protein n=1 Tax=Anguilla anguilla TaxID=7936 RepID=A0A0E9V040_ANGAN
MAPSFMFLTAKTCFLFRLLDPSEVSAHNTDIIVCIIRPSASQTKCMEIGTKYRQNRLVLKERKKA